jgi:catechol 2,3-dioxygenase-like lactoylglutathione lyase family enzyme
MKPIISDLVTRYETGRLSRRDLIQGLTMLVATASTANAADGAPETTQLDCSGVDHICVRVKDLKRSAEFYQSLFGLEPRGEDKEHRILRLGKGRHVIVSLRQDEPYGQIDHFGLKIEGFNKEAATKLLAARGLTPKEDWEYGYYVRDPDNAVVQML